MSVDTIAEYDFTVMHLAYSIDHGDAIKWISAISQVVRDMGGHSIIPGRIGRSEPILRRSGGTVVAEALDENMRRGARNRLVELAKNQGVMGLFVYDLQSAELAQNLNRIIKRPLIMVLTEKLPKKRVFSFAAPKINLDKIDHIIVPSAYLRDHLMRDHGVSQARISLVHEGIDLELISFEKISQERTVSLAHSWGAIEDSRHIVLIPEGYNSQLWQTKFLEFAKAMNAKTAHQARFVVVGDDNGSGRMNALIKQVETLAPLAPIGFVGYCADIEAAVKLSTLVIELDDGMRVHFPIAIIAQAIGRWVLLPEGNPASEEFILAGRTGEVYADSSAALLEKLSIRLSNYEGIDPTDALAARVFIQQNFSRQKMHSDLRAIFDNPRVAQRF